MQVFCHSLGEVMMDGLGVLKGLEALLPELGVPLDREGENIPGARELREGKELLVVGDRGPLGAVRFGGVFIPARLV